MLTTSGGALTHCATVLSPSSVSFTIYVAYKKKIQWCGLYRNHINLKIAFYNSGDSFLQSHSYIIYSSLLISWLDSILKRLCSLSTSSLPWLWYNDIYFCNLAFILCNIKYVIKLLKIKIIHILKAFHSFFTLVSVSAIKWKTLSNSFYTLTALFPV